MSLEDRIKKARESTVTVGNATFNCRLASVQEYVEYSIKSIIDPDVCRKHVTGWAGVTEADLIEDGKKDPVEFSAELFDLVISDKPDWWQAIYKHVIERAQQRLEDKAANEKK